MSDNDIRFKVGFDLDKNTLNEIKAELSKVATLSKGKNKNRISQELQDASVSAEKLIHILDGAWSQKLNQLNLSKLNGSIKQSFGSVENLRKSFIVTGNAGAASAQKVASAYNKFASSILSTNLQLKKSNAFLDEMATSMGNTLRWGITSSVFNGIAQSIQQAYTYTKNLDHSLNDIRIVTDKSADSMEIFARHANRAAKDLKASTLDYTQASLIYYQQGLSDQEVEARAQTTLKAANVTGQRGSEVSEQLTAVWNGYKVSAEETELYVDKLAAVAASTASDLEELSVGMSKVASAAAAMGVDIDRLDGMLSTVISVTRQAPESAGTAFKTIFARFEDLKLSGKDDSGATLGEVSGALDAVGVHILDTEKNLRDLGDVIDEVGNKWNSGIWTESEKQALAVQLAGKRQYNNLLALFDNWEMYTQAVETSRNAVGTLQHQQDIYADSTIAHIKEMQAEADSLYDTLFDQNTVNDFIDAAAKGFEALDTYFTGLGGGLNSILHIGNMVVGLFSHQIGKAVSDGIINLDAYINNLQSIQMKQEVINAQKSAIVNQHNAQGNNFDINRDSAAVEREVELQNEILAVRKGLSAEEYNRLTNEQHQVGLLEQEIQQINTYKDVAKEVLGDENATTQQLKIENNRKKENYKETVKSTEALIENYNTQKRLSREINAQNSSHKQTLSLLYDEAEAMEALKVIIQTGNFKDGYPQAIEKNIQLLASQSLTEKEAANVRIQLLSQIDGLIKQQTSSQQQQKAEIDQVTEAIKHKKQAEEGYLDTLEKEKTAKIQGVHNDLRPASQQIIMSNAVSGLSAAGMAITSSIGLAKTLSNKNLSALEKFDSVLMSLTFTLPMLVSNLGKLKDVGKAVSIGMDRFSAVLGSTQAGMRVAEKSTAKFSVALKELLVTAGPAIAIIGVSVAALAVTFLELKHSWELVDNTAKQSIKQVSTLTEHYGKLKTSVEELKKSISEYDSGKKALQELTTSTDEYEASLKRVNDQAKALIEKYQLYNDFTMKNGIIDIDENKLKQKQDELEKKQYAAQQKLYIAKIQEEKSRLDKQGTDLGRAMGLASTMLQESDFEDGWKHIQDKKEHIRRFGGLPLERMSLETGMNPLNPDNYFSTSELLQAGHFFEENGTLDDETLKELIVQNEAFSNQMRENADLLVENKRKTIELLDSEQQVINANLYYAKQILGLDIRGDYNDLIERLVKDKQGNIDEKLATQISESVGNILGKETADKIVSSEKETSKIRTSWDLNDFFKKNNIKDENGKIKSISWDKNLAYEYAETQFEDFDKSKYFYKSSTNGFGSLVDGEGNELFSELSDEFMRQQIAQSYLTEQILEDFKNENDQKVEKTSKELDELVYRGQALEELFGADFATTFLSAFQNGTFDDKGIFQLGKLDFSELFQNISPEEYEKFKNIDVESMIKDVNWARLGGANAMQAFIAGWNKEVENYSSEGWANRIISQTTDIQNQIPTLYDDVLDGKINRYNAEQNEEYQKLIENVEILTKDFPELRSEAEILSNTALIGTQLWTQSLIKLQNQINQIKLDGLNEKAKNAYKTLNKFLGDNKYSAEIALNLKDEEFKDALDSYINANYEIGVELRLQSDQVSGLFEKATDNIVEKASQIGENFIVAAKDIQELNDVFPGIIMGMERTEDGSIKLKDTMVQSATEAAKAEIEASKETTLAKLREQYEDNRMKQIHYQNLANIAGKEAKNDAQRRQKMANFKEELGRLEETNKEIQARNEKKLAENVATDSNKQAGIVAENWGEAYSASADYANEFADVAIAAHKAAQTGDAADKKKGDFGVVYQGKNGQSSEAAELEELEQGLDDDDYNWEDVQADMQFLADQYGENANHIYGAYKETEQRAEDAIKAMSDIGAGKGHDKKGNKDKKDHINLLDKEKNAYHEIDLEIKRLDRDLKKLQKAQKMLYGKELIANLNEQLNILEKQRNAYKRKIDLAQKEASVMKQALLGKGVSFDQDGYVTNYAEALQAKLDYVNGLITRYNAMSKKEQEGFKQTVEDAKRDYEKFKKQLDEYNKTVEEIIPELETKIEDALYEEISIQIEKFDMKVQMRLDMSEAEREWNEFKRKVIDDLDDDDLLGAATQGYRDFLSYYNTNGTGTGSIQARTERTNTVLEELKKMNGGGHSSIYSSYDENTGKWIDDEKSALEDLKESYKGLMEELEALEDLEDKVKQTFLDSIDAIQDSYNAQKENFELVGDQIEHDMQLMKLLYGEEAYSQMEKYFDKQIDNTKAELAAQEKAKNFWKAKMDAEQAAINAGTGNEDALKKYEANWKESLANVNSLIETWGDQMLAQYENSINKMIKALNDKLTNGLGLEYVGEELSLLDDNAKNYLDAINAAYEKQRLANKWQDAIDKSSSLSTQQKLNELMQEQMKMLEEKGKLTEYDIERAEKEYEIALKQIALQEAQQNKTSMRLKRDANGNYSYQFVADEDKIAEAEEDLAKAKNELYNFDKAAYNKNLNEMYSVWKEFQEKIADAYKKYGNDQAKLTEQIGLLQEQYGEKLNFITEQNLNIRNNLHSSAFDELSDLYDIDRQKFEEMTEAEKDLIFNELIPQWDSGVQQMIDKFAGEGGFGPVCQETFDKLGNASTDYQANLDELKDKNAEVTEEALAEGEELLDLSNQVIDKAIEEYDRIGNVIQQVLQLIETYKQAKQAAIEAAEAAYKYAQDEMHRNSSGDLSGGGGSKGPQESPDIIGGSNPPWGNSFGGGSGSGGPSGHGLGGITEEPDKLGNSDKVLGFLGNGNYDPEIGEIVTLNSHFVYDDSNGDSKTTRQMGEKVEVGTIKNRNLPFPYFLIRPYGRVDNPSDWIGFAEKKMLYGYDTGGYTGSWGSDGRLALLHQKELVLNQDDTQNMLSAVEVIRNIVSNIGNNALSQISSMKTPSSPILNNQDNIEQTVYINAKFEGQTDAIQIQTALNNLVNVAAQRANTKKR